MATNEEMTEEEFYLAEDQMMDQPLIFSFIGSNNLAPELDDSVLTEIGMRVCQDYTIDEGDFKERKEEIEDLYKLALQIGEMKNYPFDNSANIKFPLLTKAALSFAAIAYPAIVEEDSVVKGVVVGNDNGTEPIIDEKGNDIINPNTGKPEMKNAGLKAKAAERVAEFMSHNILEDMDGWEDDMDKGMLILPIVGSFFKKTYYCPIERKNVSDLVLPQYLILDKSAKNAKSANRISELIEIYPDTIQEYINSGLFVDFDFHIAHEDADGDASNTQDKDAPHVFIEQHRKIDLDRDGYSEPYIVWVHKDTQKVVRIIPRYDENSIITANDGSILKIIPECFYTDFYFFPDPRGGPYGIGFGHLLRSINEATNTTINQMIDQGHVYTVGGGFIGNGLRIRSGKIKMKPNEWKRLDTGGQDIRTQVVPFPSKEPSAVLMALMQYILESAEDIAAVGRFMSGDMPANVPPTTAMAMLEQGMNKFKAIFKRVHRSLKKEFKRIYELDAKYLTQEEYQRVLDDPNADVEYDFDRKKVDILPVSDPEVLTNMQKILKANILEAYKDDPLLDGVELRMRIFDNLKIPGAKELIKVPQKPEPDPLVMAQVALIESQIIKMRDEANLEKNKFRLEIEEMIADIKAKMAKATLDIAKAESEEKGQDLERYKLMLDGLTQLNDKLEDGKQDNAGIMGQLEK